MVFTSFGAPLSLGLLFIPHVVASPEFASFPSIPFKDFSDFILENFGPTISLPTVITVLLSMTNNTELLSLHFKQSKNGGSTAWIRCLARAIKKQLGDETTKTLFLPSELSILSNTMTKNVDITSLAKKLSQFSNTLELYPYNKRQKFTGTLKPICHDSIQPALLICPRSSVCLTLGCNQSYLKNDTSPRDIPEVTLIKGTTIQNNVQLLSGLCSKCETRYYADHERIPKSRDTEAMKIFLNSAHYLKLGQKLWVNREFSVAVVNAMYDLHASTSGWMKFFNDTYGNESLKLSPRQIWAAFVHESIRQISDASGIDFYIRDTASMEEVTQTAFITLGNNGIIQSAENHSCDECSQPYRARSDVILNPNDPSALLGVDNPVTDQVTQDNSDSEMDVDMKNVTMVVVDGIVVGTKHCAYDNCTLDLVNNRGGSFCQIHENEFGNKCRVRDCTESVVDKTMACAAHQRLWNKYKLDHSSGSLAGSKRMLNRRQEKLAWNPKNENEPQPHDQPAPEIIKPKHFFGPATFYCVETICAPCGVVVAWTKFAKSESESNILAFLKKVYPSIDSRPDYICIDKACRLLKHIVAQNQWNTWSQTTRFIVDSYHYQNHRKTDTLCRTWCNPAPTDGSAPNLVITATASDGSTYQKRAFNTQACEQLNAWLGGYESILKRMTPSKFNWLIHAMLFYHTNHVIKQQKIKERKGKAANLNDDNEDISNDGLE
jgi:CxC5 like cysteine cluster associated with KDZ transposases/CxC6 like cysteine cluster associated with KDZ transposases